MQRRWFLRISCVTVSFGAICTLLMVNRAVAGVNQWTTNGPNQGTVNTITVDWETLAILYAGTQSGQVFKSSTHGGAWADSSSGLPGLPLLSLVMNSGDSSRVFAGTTNSGFYRGGNGGMTWGLQNEGLAGANAEVLALATDPTDSEPVFAGTSGGVFVRENIGGNRRWTARSPLGMCTPVNAVVVDGTEQSLYAATSCGVYRADITTMPTGEVMLAWQQVTTTPTLTLALTRQGTGLPDVIYAGTLNQGVFESTNGGWHWVGHNNRFPPSFPPVRALAADPSNQGVVYAGTDQGVYKTRGYHWFPFNLGLSNLQVRALAVNPLASQFIYAGTAGSGVFTMQQSWPPKSDLAVTMTATPTPVRSGGLLTYAITVTNSGPPVNDVTVTDIVSYRVRIDSVRTSQSAVVVRPPGSVFGLPCALTPNTYGTATVRCYLHDVAIGVAETVTLVVVPDGVQTLTNTASVSGLTITDPNLKNNTATVVTSVVK